MQDGDLGIIREPLAQRLHRLRVLADAGAVRGDVVAGEQRGQRGDEAGVALGLAG